MLANNDGTLDSWQKSIQMLYRREDRFHYKKVSGGYSKRD
jgi:hypothetical protein